MSKRTSLKKLRGDVRAISPLIATLLLIAIAVAASVITYSWVMSMISSQSQQAQTQVRIDHVTWDLTGQKMSCTIRNTGSVAATIESFSVKKNVAGATWYDDSLDGDTATSGAVDVGDTLTRGWDVNDAGAPPDYLAPSTSYVIRVTCSTGFYYEKVAVSPAS